MFLFRLFSFCFGLVLVFGFGLGLVVCLVRSVFNSTGHSIDLLGIEHGYYRFQGSVQGTGIGIWYS